VSYPCARPTAEVEIEIAPVPDSASTTPTEFDVEDRGTQMASRATSTRLPTREAPLERERSRGKREGIFLVVRFRAPDFARLKRAFDDLQELRERHGARGHRILRLADDPQDYIVIIEFASFGGAQSFRVEPLLLRAIDAAGIEGGAHHVQYVEEFREQLEAVDYTW
jgi:hypothetical protein